MANASSPRADVRPRVTPTAIITAAERLVDRHGWAALTMTALAAEIGVQVPSLYKHVDGIDDVRRRLGLMGIRELAELVRTATLGRAGDDALVAMASAFREYVRRHPGRYVAQSELSGAGDPEYQAEAARASEAVLAVLRGYGIEGEHADRALTALWASVHGFVTLEVAGGLAGLPDADGTFERLVATFARAFGSTNPDLPTWSAPPRTRSRRKR